jgi:hypothetical protein
MYCSPITGKMLPGSDSLFLIRAQLIGTLIMEQWRINAGSEIGSTRNEICSYTSYPLDIQGLIIRVENYVSNNSYNFHFSHYIKRNLLHISVVST